MKFEKVKYSSLNAKAKEMYNFQKVAARLADYGFTSIWLTNDWQGADFIAVHMDGVTDLKVQLKARLALDIKYIGKEIWMCFRDGENFYLFPHDVFLNQADATVSELGAVRGGRLNVGKLSKQHKETLQQYKL